MFPSSENMFKTLIADARLTVNIATMVDNPAIALLLNIQKRLMFQRHLFFVDVHLISGSR